MNINYRAAFVYERFGHLPYMDISSSGESPFVLLRLRVYALRVDAHPERVLLFRARDANSRKFNKINITRGPRVHDGSLSEEIARAKGSESGSRDTTSPR